VHVLCLSTGDYAGLGATRARELRASCATLGLPDERVACVDDPQLQDGPDNAWPPARVAALVHAHLHALQASRVLTFDGRGVSGHPNHIAVSEGVRLLASSSGAPHAAPWRLELPLVAYALVSTGVLRKHLSIWDVAISLLAALSAALWRWAASPAPPPAKAGRGAGGTEAEAGGEPRLCCYATAQPRRCHAAMCSHASRYVWYRKLYVLTSRYIWVKTTRRLE